MLFNRINNFNKIFKKLNNIKTNNFARLYSTSNKDEDKDNQKLFHPTLDRKTSFPIYPPGTEKSENIIEGDAITYEPNKSHRMSVEKLNELVKNNHDKKIQGISSILSYLEQYSYLPTRNKMLLNPFIHICHKQIDYLFEKNPFLVFLVARETTPINKEQNYFVDSNLPEIINENEFFEESSKALKQIFELAENEKSIELQKISYFPATQYLLLIRDVYFSVDFSSNLDFEKQDISIDNFSFEPIDLKCYINNFNNNKYIKIQSNYRVNSNRYNEQCQNYPITAQASWITEWVQNQDEAIIDWKILDLKFKTDFNP